MIKTLIEQIQKSEREAERILSKAQKQVDKINQTAEPSIEEEKNAILSSAKKQADELIADANAKAQTDIDALLPHEQPHDVDARVLKAVDFLTELVIKKYES